jgi:hypothetical protein
VTTRFVTALAGKAFGREKTPAFLATEKTESTEGHRHNSSQPCLGDGFVSAFRVFRGKKTPLPFSCPFVAKGFYYRLATKTTKKHKPCLATDKTDSTKAH